MLVHAAPSPAKPNNTAPRQIRRETGGGSGRACKNQDKADLLDDEIQRRHRSNGDNPSYFGYEWLTKPQS
jgi:hypothetical protein